MSSHVKLILFCTIALSNVCLLKGQETTQADSTSNKPVKESERNVMLNASNANGPRQISIGLPSEDVSVYENGLPT
ncbi:MAG: TonB-dependent receptor, partial [Bacteroidales bacterium]|nr:TonB-dependent receptor [Bacteroidales bacterium]